VRRKDAKTQGREVVTSARAPEPVGPYPHARRAGNLLFLSGIGPRVKGVAGVPGVTLDAAGDVVARQSILPPPPTPAGPTGPPPGPGASGDTGTTAVGSAVASPGP